MPKSVIYRSRKLSHLDRAQIRALTHAGFTNAEIGGFFGCNPRAVERARTNNLKGSHKGTPEEDGKLFDRKFLKLIAESDTSKLKAFITASVDEQEEGKLKPRKAKTNHVPRKGLGTKLYDEGGSEEGAGDLAHSTGLSPPPNQSTVTGGVQSSLDVVRASTIDGDWTSCQNMQPVKMELETQGGVKTEPDLITTSKRAESPTIPCSPHSTLERSPSLDRRSADQADQDIVTFLSGTTPSLVQYLTIFQTVGFLTVQDLRKLHTMGVNYREDVLQELQREGIPYFKVKVFEEALAAFYCTLPVGEE